MSIVRKGLGVIILLAIVGFIGVMAYGWWQSTHPKGTASAPEPPSVSQAAYQVKIMNTGRSIFTDKIITQAIGKGYSLYTLPNGYWETEGSKFIFKKVTDPPLILDERKVGKIEVTKR